MFGRTRDGGKENDGILFDRDSFSLDGEELCKWMVVMYTTMWT